MNFDLNIDNYTKDELIQIFELPSNFDKNILEIKEAKLKNSIVHNREIDNNTREKTINFLNKAKETILDNIYKQVIKLNDNIYNSYNTNYNLKSTLLENTNDHMVQTRKEESYTSSFPDNIYPGVINPLKRRTTKKVLNIDSRFRSNYFTNPSTNYSMSLPFQLSDVVEMQLSAIELPTTYFVMSKQLLNNFFYITVDSSSALVSVPEGNYDQNTIMTAINNQLNLLGEPFDQVNFRTNLQNGITGTGQTLVGFIDVDKNRNSNISLNFQSDSYGNYDVGTPLPLKLGWLLGFRNGVYTNNLNYVSEGVVDITGSKYIYLVVDDFNNSVNNGYYNAFNDSILNNNILARISLTANPFSILQQTNLNIVTTPRQYFGPVNIQNLHIMLLDEYGRVFDLNNMDYSICLNLTTIYDI
jgi:hypothetical protein